MSIISSSLAALGLALRARTIHRNRFFRRWGGYASDRVHGIQQFQHARVFEPIIDAITFFAVLDQACKAEEHQLLRHVGLALIEQRGEVAHALFAVAERVEKAQTRGMRQGAQHPDGFAIPASDKITLRYYIHKPEYSLGGSGLDSVKNPLRFGGEADCLFWLIRSAHG
jgi:hypothetical protein